MGNPPAAARRSWTGATQPRWGARISSCTATICWTAVCSSPSSTTWDADFRETHQDIYLELGDTQYVNQVLAVLETTVESPIYRYTTDLSDPAVESGLPLGTIPGRKFRCHPPHPRGISPSSTCGDWGGDTRVLVVARLAEVVGEWNPHSAFVPWDTS